MKVFEFIKKCNKAKGNIVSEFGLVLAGKLKGLINSSKENYNNSSISLCKGKQIFYPFDRQ